MFLSHTRTLFFFHLFSKRNFMVRTFVQQQASSSCKSWLYSHKGPSLSQILSKANLIGPLCKTRFRLVITVWYRHLTALFSLHVWYLHHGSSSATECFESKQMLFVFVMLRFSISWDVVDLCFPVSSQRMKIAQTDEQCFTTKVGLDFLLHHNAHGQHGLWWYC